MLSLSCVDRFPIVFFVILLPTVCFTPIPNRHINHWRHMYIPAHSRTFPETPASAAARVDLGPPSQTSATELRRHQSLSRTLHHAANTITRFFTTSHRSTPDLRKRDPLQSTNVTIGAVVGVLLGVFIIGTIYFCVRYHRSIRFGDHKKRRHRRSGGSSRGSKASASSASTAPAPPAPPAPPPEAAAG
jgi:hypothetical protein